jgi:hypothetical protein
MLFLPGYAEDHRCSMIEAQHAEAEADTLRTWSALYNSYKKYRQCDDGAIAEGYSESVARILVDHWDTLPTLVQLVKQTIGFQQFVVKHVDETLNASDLKQIAANAATRCPTGLRGLCKDLQKRADAR